MREIAEASRPQIAAWLQRARGRCLVFSDSEWPDGCTPRRGRFGLEVATDTGVVTLLVDRGVRYAGGGRRLARLFANGSMTFVNQGALERFVGGEVRAAYAVGPQETVSDCAATPLKGGGRAVQRSTAWVVEERGSAVVHRRCATHGGARRSAQAAAQRPGVLAARAIAVAHRRRLVVASRAAGSARHSYLFDDEAAATERARRCGGHLEEVWHPEVPEGWREADGEWFYTLAEDVVTVRYRSGRRRRVRSCDAERTAALLAAVAARQDGAVAMSERVATRTLPAPPADAGEPPAPLWIRVGSAAGPFLYSFRFVQHRDAWRAIIAGDVNWTRFGWRDSSLLVTHRHVHDRAADGTERTYVCWTVPLRTQAECRAVAKAWAVGMTAYIVTGRRL